MNYGGTVDPDFIPVAECFAGQIPDDGRSGAALAVYFRGEKVVDIWGGKRDHQGNDWDRDTLACSFSTTKGVTSTLVHLLADRGALDLDAPVARYWPEFAQQGKGRITVRQVLTHRTGLHRIRTMLDDPMRMIDWESMVQCIARAEPVTLPAGRSAYQAITYGWILGEVLQRITGRPFAEILANEIARPLGLEGFFVGLPEARFSRRALLAGFPEVCRDEPVARKRHQGERWSRKVTGVAIRTGIHLTGARWQETLSALAPRGMRRFSFNDPRVVQSCIPAANGMFCARDLARMYALLAEGGALDGIRLLSSEAIRRMNRIHVDRVDLVLPVNMRWRLGFHRVFTSAGKLPVAFGHFGWGGSGAWADPAHRLAVGFTVNNHRSTSPAGDWRIIQLNGLILKSALQKLSQTAR